MLLQNKNLKDFKNGSGINIKDTFLSISYEKTNKLITALYMVTDIIDRDEPLRNKLRTLGTEIISDINSIPHNACVKLSQIMAFLDIASAVNIISEMNSSILKKEFLELNQSIKESMQDKPTWLEDFLLTADHIGHELLNKEQKTQTRIGVQKGSTLLKALSDKTQHLSDKNYTDKNQFEMLKKERREKISSIIKDNYGNATIKDIIDKINANGQDVSMSEKTLQRELISMVRDGVLNKIGEKRWSKYFLKT